MKTISILFFILALSLVAGAQKKPVKPSLSKAERVFRDGKLDLAKDVIDATTASKKFSTNAKAWYLRGIIYMSLDTTQNEQFSSLVDNPFLIGVEAFNTYNQLKDEKNTIYLLDNNGALLLPTQIEAFFAQNYFDKGLAFYQDKKDYKNAFKNVEQALFFIPKDTSILLNMGLFFSPAAEEHQQTVDYLKKYLTLGGRSVDAYTMLFSTYRDYLKNEEKALEIAKKAMIAYPNNPNFPKYELDMYIKMNKLEEARDVMEKQVKKTPNDSETLYYLGVINQELGNQKSAKQWHEKSIEAKSDYLDPRIALAELVYLEAKIIKTKMNALGISKEDKKKRLELDGILVQKLKMALPYWENCEKLDKENQKTLDTLLSIYTNLGMEQDMKRIQKTMEKLGLY